MIEKGGESMSLEAMKQVTEAEEANRARRAEAQAEAKRLVAEAERAGKAAWRRPAPRQRPRRGS